MSEIFRRFREGRKGFTLIEILLVIAIVAVLIGISVSGLRVQQKKARDARRKADIEEIRAALEQYRTVNGYYYKEGSGKVSQLISSDNYTDNGTFPADPKTGYDYMISFSDCPIDPNQCGKYQLQALMEVNPPVWICVIPPLNCSTSPAIACNYCITQP